MVASSEIMGVPLPPSGPGTGLALASWGLGLALAAPLVFGGLLVATTGGGPAYPADWLSWLSLALPVLGGLLGLVALVSPGAAPGQRRRALAALFLAVVSHLLVTPANRALRTSELGERETRPLGALRSLMSAQAAYAAVNRGSFGDIACLEAPSSCLPSYSGPAFLEPGWSDRTFGSAWRFSLQSRHRAPGTESRDESVEAARDGAPGWVALVEPTWERGLLDRVLGVRAPRSFCGESSGRVCTTRPGRAPPVAAGRCAESDPAYDGCFE